MQFIEMIVSSYLIVSFAIGIWVFVEILMHIARQDVVVILDVNPKTFLIFVAGFYVFVLFIKIGMTLFP